MEDSELYLWLATIKRAKQGDEASQADLKVENEKRVEQGRPTIEEEILSMLEK